MLPLTWACPGKQVAFRAKTLLFSLMGHCGALLSRNSSHMNTAEKPTGACVSCMEPAFAIVAPAHYASSVNGTAAPPKSHARSACCCIPSKLGRLPCSGVTGGAGSIDGHVCCSCTVNGLTCVWNRPPRSNQKLPRPYSPVRSGPTIGSRGLSDWLAMLEDALLPVWLLPCSECLEGLLPFSVSQPSER
jgi:hypothetical protein